MPTDISPVNGWLWEAINTTQAAAPMVKMTMAMATAARLSLWTRAMVSALHRGHHLALRNRLSFTLGKHGNDEVDRLGIGIGNHRQRRLLLGHGRPFLTHRLLDVTADKRPYARREVSGKAGSRDVRGFSVTDDLTR